MKRRDAIKRTALLMGYAVSATAMAGVMQGCQADTAPGWKPEFFSDAQIKNLGEAVERILPATKTPGAKDLMVDRFIDSMMKNIFKPEQSAAFMKGLDNLEAAAQTAHNQSFAELDDSQKDALLTNSMNDAEKKEGGDDENKPFFTRLKELTFLGYFSSEKIGKEVLAYDPVPGRYEGCIPLEGNAWALN